MVIQIFCSLFAVIPQSLFIQQNDGKVASALVLILVVFVFLCSGFLRDFLAASVAVSLGISGSFTLRGADGGRRRG